jgi:hypothetical protein
MTDFFAAGHAADAILAVLACEALVLVWRGRPVADALAIVLPAVLIVLGLRAALIGAAWPLIALPLALAFPAHLWDLSRRRMRD